MAFKLFQESEYFRDGRFIIGTTALKELTAENYCPRKLYNKYMLGITDKGTESMSKGSFFETLILGSGAKGKVVNQIERNKDGSMSADEKRIRWIAANIWPKVVEQYQIKISKKQLPLSMDLTENFIMETHLDILGMVGDVGAIIDVKMCGNINNTFGDYSWGEPHLMDHSQATMCKMLVEHNYKESAAFFYAVFDYKPESDYKVLCKKIGDVEVYELQAKLQLATERFIDMLNSSWPENPSYSLCRYCSVPNCNKRIQRKDIQFF